MEGAKLSLGNFGQNVLAKSVQNQGQIFLKLLEVSKRIEVFQTRPLAGLKTGLGNNIDIAA